MKGIIKGFGWLLLFVVLQGVVGLIGGFIIALVDPVTTAFHMVEVIIMLTSIAGVITIWLMYMSKRKDDFIMEKIRFKLSDKKDIILMILTSVALVMVVNCVLGFVDVRTVGYDSVQENVADSMTSILGIVNMCIIIPIIEEVIFRGFIFNEIRKTTGLGIAIVAQGLIFGVAHLNIVQGIYAFLLGLILCRFYVKTKSLAVPIIGHIAYNIMGTIGVTFLAPYLSGTVFYIVVGISVILILGTLAYLGDSEKEQCLETEI